MGATIDFYIDVLGVPLVYAVKVPPALGTRPGHHGNPPYDLLPCGVREKASRSADSSGIRGSSN
ncbi:MAG: hypothetical protein JO122_21535 [Acetobacteraceae bacterium]|nr:hypothetical protein [Acetobacteraceae bacterium]